MTTPPPKDPLDDILEHVYVTATQDERGVANNRKDYRMRYEEIPALAKQQILTHYISYEDVLELIGEDEIENPKELPEGENRGYDYAVCSRAGRNKLRAELKAALKKRRES